MTTDTNTEANADIAESPAAEQEKATSGAMTIQRPEAYVKIIDGLRKASSKAEGMIATLADWINADEPEQSAYEICGMIHHNLGIILDTIRDIIIKKDAPGNLHTVSCSILRCMFAHELSGTPGRFIPYHRFGWSMKSIAERGKNEDWRGGAAMAMRMFEIYSSSCRMAEHTILVASEQEMTAVIDGKDLDWYYMGQPPEDEKKKDDKKDDEDGD